MNNYLRAILLICLLLIQTSCSDTMIDPFSNDGRFFTIYGFVDEFERQQAIRVIPITRKAVQIDTPSADQAFIDATVSSKDLLTGEITHWQHSLEELDDGSYGHIFRTAFFPRRGRTYELTVLRSDGVTTKATTTLPYLPITKPAPDTLFFPYEISPDSAWSQEVNLPGISSPWDIIVTYDLQGLPARVFYGRPGERTEEGWRFNIDPSADAPEMRQFMGIPEGNPLPLLHAIEIQVRVLDDDWDPPRGIFDPELIARPGVLSNVENGYGLWGSIGFYQYTWIAPPQIQSD